MGQPDHIQVQEDARVIQFPGSSTGTPTRDDLDLFARRLAPRLASELWARQASPWRNAQQAAAHLACSLSRVRKLTGRGDLKVHREGGRVLYHVDDLDAFVRAGGAFTE